MVRMQVRSDSFGNCYDYAILDKYFNRIRLAVPKDYVLLHQSLFRGLIGPQRDPPGWGIYEQDAVL